MAVVLTSTGTAGSLDGFYPTIWGGGQVTDIKFSEEVLRIDQDFNETGELGLSLRVPDVSFGVNADIDISFSGDDFNKLQVGINLCREAFMGVYVFAGPNITLWDIKQNFPRLHSDWDAIIGTDSVDVYLTLNKEKSTKPGFGFQTGLERALIVESDAILSLQAGYRYNTGAREYVEPRLDEGSGLYEAFTSDVDWTSNTVFMRLGLYMTFLD